MEWNNIKNHSMPSSSGFGQFLLEFEREPDSLVLPFTGKVSAYMHYLVVR